MQSIRRVVLLQMQRGVYVCLLVTTMSSAKTAEPIEMPFGAWTQVRPTTKKLCVKWGAGSPGEWAFFVHKLHALRLDCSEYRQMLR